MCDAGGAPLATPLGSIAGEGDWEPPAGASLRLCEAGRPCCLLFFLRILMQSAGSLSVSVRGRQKSAPVWCVVPRRTLPGTGSCLTDLKTDPRSKKGRVPRADPRSPQMPGSERSGLLC